MTFKREFGKMIPGLELFGRAANYPVLNERDVRAGADIMFGLGTFAFANAALTKQFIFLETFVILFFLEFAIRIFINPEYAPIYAVAQFLVKNQNPEWAGAIQKKFAWGVGLTLATSMIFIAVIFQIRGILPFSICALCLVFLWAESALGICIGCKMYTFMENRSWIRTDVKPACAGGVCELRR